MIAHTDVVEVTGAVDLIPDTLPLELRRVGVPTLNQHTFVSTTNVQTWHLFATVGFWSLLHKRQQSWKSLARWKLMSLTFLKSTSSSGRHACWQLWMLIDAATIMRKRIKFIVSSSFFFSWRFLSSLILIVRKLHRIYRRFELWGIERWM